MSKIEVSDVSLDYIDNGTLYHALDGISFNVEEGEFLSIIGSSGCGKSTTLNLLSGLLTFQEGTVLIDGEHLREPGQHSSIVFQHYSLYPWMTAKKNVVFAIAQSDFGKSKTKKEIHDIAGDWIEKVGLSGFENKYPFQLSGGMQQRVAIARTLAQNTPIIYMDEPFGAVDAKTRLTLQDLLMDLLAAEKRTIVFVTHDVEEAIFLSDRILFMDNKRITSNIKLPFSRPRKRRFSQPSPEYHRIRSQIMGLFNVPEAYKITGDEIVF